MTSPNGTKYTNADQYRSWLGECHVTINPVVLDHNGTWTCVFARKTGLPDEKIYVDVVIAEQLTFYQSIDAKKGHSVELMCKTGLPIRFCRYISPSGESYHLSTEKSSTR